MFGNLTGWHFLIILVIVLLLFGAPKLPLLARSLGQSMKIFKSEIKSDEPDDTVGTGSETSRDGATRAGSSSAAGTDTPDPTTKS
jgi:sec-independent protein translocase protein TatA